MPFNDVRPVFLIVAGPAGSGKTTLCDRLVQEVPEVRRVLTATTRPPRPGESDGVHYHFLTEEEFDARLARGEFLEWARVHGRYRYGTLRRPVLEQLAAGRSVVINIDVQGVRSLQAAAKSDPLLRNSLVTVFVAPASLEELRARMLGRGQDAPEEIERRMITAAEEMAQRHIFDHVITSGTREEDFAALRTIWEESRRRVESTTPEPGAGPG